jgi:hypothetical protein
MENKLGTNLFKILTVLFVIGAAASAIVNLAVSGGITWAVYPLAVIAFAWVICIPAFLARKNKALLALLAFTAAVIPFLYVLDKFGPYGGWFSSLGLPIAIVSLVCWWISFAVFKYTKLNIWYKSAAVVFVFGVVVSTAIRFYLAGFTGGIMSVVFNLDSIINLIACLAATILLVIIGTGKRRELSAKTNNGIQK